MALYYLPPLRPAQRHLLIGASFVFYAANEPWLLLLLLFSIAVNIVTSHKVHHGPPRARTAWAAAGVALNLGVLAFFKYSPLFARTFLGGGGELGEFLLMIPLPVGISFFTFQGITLLVDTLRYRNAGDEHILPQHSLVSHALNTTLYIAFFPQLVAGPIVKAHEFIPQIRPRFLRDVDWEYCFRHLVLGYFLKMVVADNLRDQTFWIAYPYFQGRSTVELVGLLFGYSVQIFADFAGYSLIAIGVAGLFGYVLPQNFNFPYISRSFSEFWRRWHISLSTFLRDYLYIPLGGNRRGAARTYLNLMLVMLLGGLWHGAAWSYMVWGGFHGAALALERLLSRHVTLPDHPLVRGLRMVGVFTFVTFAWLLFKLPEFAHVIAYVRAVADNVHLPTDLNRMVVTLLYCLPVIAWHLLHLHRARHPTPAPPRLAPAAYGAMLFLLLVNSGPPGAFIYFQF